MLSQNATLVDQGRLLFDHADIQKSGRFRMRIVYTNLQENDCGTKRSVRQVQLDFSKGSNRWASLHQGSPHAENEDWSTVVFGNSDLPARKRRIGDDGSPARDEKAAGSQGAIGERGFFQGSLVITSLAGCYIRKFIETQMVTARRMDERNRINVFV